MHIKNDYSLFVSKKLYEPDLTFLCLDNKSILIDIEIDEPYDGLQRIPIHYKTSNGTIDDFRNNEFSDRGWMVVRFAEEQVYKNPDGCCFFLYELIKSIDDRFVINSTFDKVESIDRIKIWTREEAIKLADEKYREKYLGINQFINKEKYIKEYVYNESPMGLKIEEKIINKQKDKINESKSKDSVELNTSFFTVTQKNSEPSKPSPSRYA